MPQVSKVTQDHFQLVYPLLKKFDDSHSKEQWMNIFSQPFNNGEDHCGYMLLEEGEIVGFLGYIFSKKIVDNKTVKFCNLTTWIVEDDYRNSSLALIYPVLKMKDYCVTNFIPAKNVYYISKKLGFKDLEACARITIPVFNPFKAIFYHCKFITNTANIINELSSIKEGYLITIINDHKKYSCHFILLKSKTETCLVLFTKVKRKNLPLAYIHFISNHNMFFKYFDQLKFKLWFHYKLLGPIIEERNMHGHRVFSIKERFTYPQIFMSKTVNKMSIDNLYSELIMLN